MDKLLNDLKKIETLTDLKKRKLTLLDFNILQKTIEELIKNKCSEFINERVKNHLQKFNIKIKTCGVGWIATI